MALLTCYPGMNKKEPIKKKPLPQDVWIQLALNDIKSSRILYEKGEYRNAYFLFQQASEKANKAMWLISGFVTAEELFNLKHDQFKVFRTAIIKQLENVKEIQTILSHYPQAENKAIFENSKLALYKKNLAATQSFFDGAKQLDLVNIPTSELTQLHRKLLSLEKIKLKIPVEADRKVKKNWLDLADWIGNFNTPEAIEAKHQILEYISDPANAKDIVEQIIHSAFIVVEMASIEYTLFACAVLTIQHSSISRYPDEKFNPIELYNLRLPLVKKMPLFVNSLEKAILKLSTI
jgi:HEPN domain-containing protein